MNNASSILIAIFDDIDHRVRNITQAQPAWPCHQGCNSCCHRLPFLPEISEAEWDFLYQGFMQLPIAIQNSTKQKLLPAIQAEQTDPFITCPLLNNETGDCLVYTHRPAACRMYGYYVTRSSNRWCDLIQERYEEGFAEGIMLGNQQAVEQQLTQHFGKSQSLALWFREQELIN